jgi:phytoene dehydrogenase-like protein
MLLSHLPRLRDSSVDPGAAFAGTFHVNEDYSQLQRAYAAAAAGHVPDPVPCELYCHSLSDRSILGADLAATDAQTLTLFGLHLPARLFRADNDVQREVVLAATLSSLNSVLAEPIEDLILRDGNGKRCLEAMTPLDLEAELGMPGGNIFHRSLQWPWARSADEVGTWGVETAYERVLVCGAGARRGGGVSGIPGHNAAQRVLEM